MINITLNIATTVLSNIVQLIIGCLISIPVYLICLNLKNKVNGDRATSSTDYLLMAIFSLCGIALPLGIYGVIPIFLALIAAGFRFYTVLPLIISNLLFNMLVPFNDPGFIWRTGVRRIILAFIAGLVAGLLMKSFKITRQKVLRENNSNFPVEYTQNPKSVLHIIDKSIKKTGFFIIAGVIADTFLHRYALGYMINAIYTNPLTSVVPGFFSRYDVTNPYFLLTFLIAYTLMDLVKMSALLFLLKPKYLAMYIIYFFIMAVILAIPAFI